VTEFAIDTSVAVPLMLATHPRHAAIAAWAEGKRLFLCGHAAAETFSVMTRLPGDLSISAADAVAVIDSAVEGVLPLSEASQRTVHRDLAAQGVVGGAAYDGLVALAARESGLPLATADSRARGTYAALEVDVVIPPADGR
jgi:predicted nucleic acid-binding protein